MEKRICKGNCGKELPLTIDFFYIRSDNCQFGNICKECVKERTREQAKKWNNNNKEKVNKRNQEWRNINQEKVKIYAKNYNLKIGKTTGKGQSIGEMKIEQYFINNLIQYIYGKSFEDCRNKKGNKLEFDFYLPELNICIEFDGFLHFKSIWPGQLKKFQEHDQIKTNYCLIKGIQLIRIKENESIEEVLKKILITI